MSDTQLDVSIEIRKITIILAWLSNKADMNALRPEVRADNATLRVNAFRMDD